MTWDEDAEHWHWRGWRRELWSLVVGAVGVVLMFVALFAGGMFGSALMHCEFTAEDLRACRMECGQP